MNKNAISHTSLHLLIMAWLVHAFTASASFIGLWSIIKIFDHEYVFALWLMAITIIIDAVDGTLARLVNVKEVIPKFDGTLLDNIVDYLNYVIVPSVFLLINPGMMSETWGLLLVFLITLTSSYQFCQSDAKTPDHFFKGFPCYWNIAVFYMFIFQTSAATNLWIIIILSILIFVPIKYVYPSRLDYLTKSKRLKWVMHSLSIIYGISSALLLWIYPLSSVTLLSLSFGYAVIYLLLSIYRTISPLEHTGNS